MAATRSESTGGAPDGRLRLYVNIDHVATVRQARKADEPDPVAAAALCEAAGADGITAHLREDRRHIQDSDVEGLVRGTRSVFNLEMAATQEMVRIAQRLHPYQITTEGGLDVGVYPERLADTIAQLKSGGIRVSLFIDPDPGAIAASQRLGAVAIELHTGRYANAARAGAALRDRELAALADAASVGRDLGLAVHAGHGLTVRNVGPVAAIGRIEELNIGHSIVSRAIFVGLAEAVREMRVAMDAARSSHYAGMEPFRAERR
jgi:pyridoxine 5-phosphate synthase